MVNQKVAEIASQAAATRMSEMMQEIQTGSMGSFPEKSVYAKAFEELLVACEITPEIFEERIRAFAATQTAPHNVPAVIGNLLKESKRPEMGHKIFKRMIQAVFPA